MTSSDFDREEQLAIAGRIAHERGLDVIEAQRVAGDDDFDLIARDGGILVAIRIVIAQPGDSCDRVIEIAETRMNAILDSAYTWMRDHGFEFGHVRLDVIAFIPMLADLIGFAYAEEVA